PDKYSIILPVHNGGEHLKECVNSILNQSRRDFNLIVLENCSTDGSLEWLRSLDNHKIIIHPSAAFLSIQHNWKRITQVPKYEFLAAQMEQTIDSTGTGYMMRSTDYDGLGGIPTNYPAFIFADYELWIRLSSISYKATSPEICFDYRIHNNASKLMNGDNYQK